ncbi:hypothetical protein VQ042_22750 [Aurantimonas sp. A2-1-M11]|uniref:DUF6894 family protein n=1 Tax=Aurantimonas sp. A2-1-M11 TaxID=3113712 RepID=UPI002F91FECB
MPRYFFHLERGGVKIPDVTGCEAVSDLVIIEVLGEILMEYAEELVLCGITGQDWNLSVVDHSGRLLARVEI